MATDFKSLMQGAFEKTLQQTVDIKEGKPPKEENKNVKFQQRE